MNVSLTPTLEKLIMEEVKKGYYNNSSEFVRDAIRELLFKLKQDRLKELIHLAELQVQRGEVTFETADEITSKVFKEYENRVYKSSKN